MKPLVGYLPLNALEQPAPLGAMFDYLFSVEGVFVRGERAGLQVCLPVASCELRGLRAVDPFVTLAHGPIPAHALSVMLSIAKRAEQDGAPVEALFHLWWADTWQVDMPEQEAGPTHVRPLDDGPDSSYARAVVELHSHHAMPAFFSAQDDRDETAFRIYAVIGDIFKAPQIKVRAGLYGYHWDIPAAWIFQLPEGMTDNLLSTAFAGEEWEGEALDAGA